MVSVQGFTRTLNSAEEGFAQGKPENNRLKTIL